jgi:carboxyl-terminal processing protease
MMRNNLLVGTAAFVLGAGAMAYVGATADAQSRITDRDYFRKYDLFATILDETKRKYVTEVNEEDLIEAAIAGMLTSLDPHSSYLDPDAFDDMRDTTRGAYGGLGLEVTSEEGAVRVITPMDDTPASRAGIEAGDFIIAIDGDSVLGLPLSDAVNRMKGQPGEPIVLTIAREETDPFDVTVVREIIQPKAAVARIEGDVGYLRLGSGFNEKTTTEARDAIVQLQRDNPNMRGLVLDLRNNPGGLLEQAVSVAGLFLDGGEVVSQRGRDPADVERYNARRGDILEGLPMVVLVNNGSASAAEIVAGALQDRQRAEIVGVTSYGKGSVQTLFPLRNGVDGALKLTTGRYFTPSGRSIQRTGIEPDLEVAASRLEAERLASQSFNISTEAANWNALDADEGLSRRGAHEGAEAPPEAFEEPCVTMSSSERIRAGATCDFQLTRAIDVIHYGSVANTPKMPGLPELAAAPGPNIPGLPRSGVERAPAE